MFKSSKKNLLIKSFKDISNSFDNFISILSLFNKYNFPITPIYLIDIKIFEHFVYDLKLQDIIKSLEDRSVFVSSKFIDEVLQDISLNSLSENTINILNNILNKMREDLIDYHNKFLIISEDSNFKTYDTDLSIHNYSFGNLMFDLDDFVQILKNIITQKLISWLEHQNTSSFLKQFSNLIVQRIVLPEISGIVDTNFGESYIKIYSRLGLRDNNLSEYDEYTLWINSRSLQINKIFQQKSIKLLKITQNKFTPISEYTLKLTQTNEQTTKLTENNILDLLRVIEIIKSNTGLKNYNYRIFWCINGGKLYIEYIHLLSIQSIKHINNFEKNKDFKKNNLITNISNSLDDVFVDEDINKKQNLIDSQYNVNKNNQTIIQDTVNITHDRNDSIAENDSENTSVSNQFLLQKANINYSVIKLDELFKHATINLVDVKRIIHLTNVNNLFLAKEGKNILDLSDMGSNTLFRTSYYRCLYLDLYILLNTLSFDDINSNSKEHLQKLLFYKLSLQFNIVLSTIKNHNNLLFIKLLNPKSFGNSIDDNLESFFIVQISAFLDAYKKVSINDKRLFFILPAIKSISMYENLTRDFKTRFKKYINLNFVPEILYPSAFINFNKFKGNKYIFFDLYNLIRLIYNEDVLDTQTEKDFISIVEKYVFNTKRKSINFIFKTSTSLSLINKYLKDKNCYLINVKYS